MGSSHHAPLRSHWIALKEQNQETLVSARFPFILFSRQFERCFTIQSSSAFSKPISVPAFSLSIHLCFKISSRSARNSLYRTEFFTNCDLSSWVEGISRLSSIRFRGGQPKPNSSTLSNKAAAIPIKIPPQQIVAHIPA